jgi:hypothetical protein
MLRFPTAVIVTGLLAVPAAGCATSETSMPRCRSDQRLGIVAQSASGAAYLPCVADLPAGWAFRSFDVDNDGTRFALRSDRDPRPVRVTLVGSCDVRGAIPVAPRAEGVRTYQRTESISPRYAGWLYDVFPGGCITYEFDFRRGPHIALMEEFQQAVQLYARRDLRRGLHEKFGINLDAGE